MMVKDLGTGGVTYLVVEGVWEMEVVVQVRVVGGGR